MFVLRKHAAIYLATLMFAKRPRQEEMPIEGAGVSQKKDKKLEELGYEFIEARDEKAKLATEMTALETKMKDRMAVLGISVYKFGDQEMRIDPGKSHVKIKTVKVESSEVAEPGEKSE